MVCEREPLNRSSSAAHANISRAALPATLGSSARRRGGDAARQRARDHDRERRRRRCRPANAGSCRPRRRRRVREDGQDVALLLENSSEKNSRTTAASTKPGDEEPVDPGLQPAAGEEREHERREERRPDVLEHLAERLRHARVELVERAARRGGRSPSRSSAGRCGCPAAGATRRGRTPRTSRRPGGRRRRRPRPARRPRDDRHERADLGRDRERPQGSPETRTSLGAAKRPITPAPSDRGQAAISPRRPTAPNGSFRALLVGQTARLRSGLVAGLPRRVYPEPRAPAGAKIASTTATAATAARLVRSVVASASRPTAAGPTRKPR